MSLIAELIKYRKDIVFLGERVDGAHGGEERNDRPPRGPRAPVDPHRNLD